MIEGLILIKSFRGSACNVGTSLLEHCLNDVREKDPELPEVL